MALDGAFLRHIKKEIEDQAISARVDKIYQPSRDELVLFLRTRHEMFRLLMSARANSPPGALYPICAGKPQDAPYALYAAAQKAVGGQTVGNPPAGIGTPVVF